MSKHQEYYDFAILNRDACRVRANNPKKTAEQRADWIKRADYWQTVANDWEHDAKTAPND